MPDESLPDMPASRDAVAEAVEGEDVRQASAPESGTELPVELSQFSQRLASFGLGETPDPLLTEARPPGKRRTRR